MKAAHRTICIGVVACAVMLGTLGDAAAQQRKKVTNTRTPQCSEGATTLVARYKTEKGEALPASIPKPLTKKPGDAERGLEAAVNPGKGNCLACHHIAKVLAKADSSDQESVETYGNHGEVGPPLNGVGARYSTSELRMILVDPNKAFPDADTIMPAYHARPGNKDISRACRGRVMLSPQAIEDIVTFLEELK